VPLDDLAPVPRATLIGVGIGETADGQRFGDQQRGVAGGNRKAAPAPIPRPSVRGLNPEDALVTQRDVAPIKRQSQSSSESNPAFATTQRFVEAKTENDPQLGLVDTLRVETAPAMLPPDEPLDLDTKKPVEGLPTMPLEQVPDTDRSDRQGGGYARSNARSQRPEGGTPAGLPTLPPEGMPDFSQGLPTLQVEASVSPLPPFWEEPKSSSKQAGYPSSFASFDDLSVRDDEQSAFSKAGLKPVSTEEAEAQANNVAEELDTNELHRSSQFSDTTVDAQMGRPLVGKQRGLNPWLVVLWVVAIAAAVAATMLALFS
jgi:hypothetical protein